MSIRRTAILAWDYPPSASGLAIAAREIAESLAGAGVEVTLFCLDRSGTETHGGVRVVGCLPEKSGVAGFLRRRMALGHLVGPSWLGRRLAAHHVKAPFDCVEATNWYAPGALATQIVRLPFVTRHSTPAATSGALSGKGLRNRLDGRFACGLEARTAKGSDGHIFNTAPHEAKVRALYGLSDAAPSAVVGLSLPPARLEAAARAPYPPAGEAVEILFVGRPEHRKGFDCLMEASEILARETASGALPRFTLRLAGIEAGDLSERSDGVRAVMEPLGRLDDAALDAAYGRAHLVAAPSRYESFGLVYQEALAFGRPVAGLGLDPSARGFVGDAGAGLLAKADSGPALAEVLRPMIADGDLRLSLRDKALRAAGRFTRASLAAGTLDLYAAAIDRHGASRRK
ncbi:glycosyltransferase [Fulvimarina endophytica]|uniref:Glycosyltransferase n=1 Tax=Fulvimarina endophytica TaxID=2293836 RepID=A0A371X555_9HYPH|nr:glycosyltransferase family 4 protein [Fulvimarina endophytica]RFC64353.1 glycosyltransferase [Fulvimarina endophytica]